MMHNIARYFIILQDISKFAKLECLEDYCKKIIPKRIAKIPDKIIKKP